MILIVHSSYKSGVYINKFTCAIFLKFESKKLKKGTYFLNHLNNLLGLLLLLL
jgi:hypothetical protein